MGWIHKVIVMPLRRAWAVLLVRVHHHNKRGRGVGMLYDDVQLCAYEDVQVMWSMLQHSKSMQALPTTKAEHKAKRLSRFWSHGHINVRSHAF